MKRTPLKRVGKIGRRNLNANRKLKVEYEDKGITSCEVRLSQCMGDFGLSFHHKEKREEYIDCPELLGEFNETVLACSYCHYVLDKDKVLSDSVFAKLRPEE